MPKLGEKMAWELTWRQELDLESVVIPIDDAAISKAKPELEAKICSSCGHVL